MTHHVGFPYCTDQCFTKFVKIINFDQMLELGIQANEINNNLTHTCILEASCTRYIPEFQTIKLKTFDQMLELGIQANEIKNNLTHTCILEASCTRYIPEHQTFKLIMFDQNYFCSNVYFVNTTYFVIQ